MQAYTMKVSKKEGGEYKEVGAVPVFFPTLAEMGINIEPTGKDEDGLVTYADDKVQFVADALAAAVKANARNKLVSGTATLKDGCKIAETVEELIAAGTRNGEALALRRDYFASFKAWLPSKQKPAAWVVGIYDIVSNSKNLPYQSQARKDLVLVLLGEHAATLPEADRSKYERVINSLLELVQTADPLSE